MDEDQNIYLGLYQLKILVFQKSGQIGGAETNLNRWMTHFRRKFNVSFYCCGPGVGPFFDTLDTSGIPCFKSSLPDWRKGKNLYSRYREQSRIKKVLQDIPFDLLFSNDFFYAPYAMHLAKSKGIPVIVHVQSDCDTKRVRQYHLNNTDGIIVTTRETLKKVEKTSKHPRLIQIPCGVDDPYPLQQSKDGPMRISRENVVFGIAANLLPHKGIDFVFELVKCLTPIPGWEIHWVGGDPQNRLEALRVRTRDLGLSDRLYFHGFKENMASFYQSIDCLIHPAQFEPFGIVLVEAMSYGIPVISTDTNGGKEILGEIAQGQWLVPLNGWKTMASKIEEMIHFKKNLKMMGEEFREKYLEKYTLSMAMKNMERFFVEVLRGG